MGYYSTTITGSVRIYSSQLGGSAITVNGVAIAYVPDTIGDVSFSGSADLSFDPRSYSPSINNPNASILSYSYDVDYHPDTTYYKVTCQNDGHGTLTANKSTATEGTQVTLTPTPASGYVFDKYTVTPSSVRITSNKFTMPGQAVTVKAFFKASYTKVVAGNKIKATDRSQTGTSTTAGAVMKDSHFSAGESVKASTFNSKVLGG